MFESAVTRRIVLTTLFPPVLHGLIHVALDLGVRQPISSCFGNTPDSLRCTARQIPFQGLRRQFVDGLTLIARNLSDAFPEPWSSASVLSVCMWPHTGYTVL
jgi:hypothetical protein